MSALFPTYSRLEIEIEAAHGSVVTDTNGKDYLDFVSGIGVVNLGHKHPKVQEAIREQLDKVWHVSNLFQINAQEEAAKKLTEHSSGNLVMFCNSGAEANEAAIKVSRKHTGKQKIITCQQSFHGRTFATMSATGQDKIKQGYGPLLETFEYVPYNNAEVLADAVDNETAAVMIETVQGEGGVIPGTPQFLQEVQRICTDRNLLFIVDEVQTGIGRTGKPFAYQHHNLSPDIITTAKGIGNGFPAGAMIGKQNLVETFGPGSHGTTFGGNPLAMAAVNAVLDIAFDSDFLDDVTVKGEYLLSRLKKELADSRFVKEVRGKGLMIGIACIEEVSEITKRLREEGMLVLNAGPNVIRLLPPLIITKEEIDYAVLLIVDCIKTTQLLRKVR